MKINYVASPFWTFGVVAALMAAPALADNGRGDLVTLLGADGDRFGHCLGRKSRRKTVRGQYMLMLGAPRNEDSSSAIAERIGNAPAGGLAKVEHVLDLDAQRAWL